MISQNPYRATMTDKIVITYFPIHARAAAARMALLYADVPFEVESVTIPAWLSGENKNLEKYPLGDVPVFSVNGQVVSGSLPMWQYCGAKAGLWPTDIFETSRVLEYFCSTEEIFTGYDGVNLIQTIFMQNEEEKKKAREGPVSGRVAFYMRRVEEIAQLNGACGRLVGAKPTIADFHLWWMAATLVNGDFEYLSPTLVTSLPGVMAVKAAVEALAESHPALKAYMAEAVPPKAAQ